MNVRRNDYIIALITILLLSMGILEIILILLVLSWIGGFAFQFGGDLIHLLLVVALIVFLFRLFRGRV